MFVGDAELLMPGENNIIYLALYRKMIMSIGQTFTIRENNVTVATGIITECLKNVDTSNGLSKIHDQN